MRTRCDCDLLAQYPRGTAILFSGEITHAGRTVTGGERCVFVSSFDFVPDSALAATSLDDDSPQPEDRAPLRALLDDSQW